MRHLQTMAPTDLNLWEITTPASMMRPFLLPLLQMKAHNVHTRVASVRFEFMKNNLPGNTDMPADAFRRDGCISRQQQLSYQVNV